MREWLTVLGLAVLIWVGAAAIRPSHYQEAHAGTGSVPVISGGELVSLNQPTVASSVESTSLGAAKATDSSSSSRWSSQFSNNQWIYVDLGQVRSLLGVVLSWEAAYGRSYKLQVSNDVATWVDVFSTTSGNGGYDVVDGMNVSGRYVRMLGLQRATQYGYSLFSFDVYARQDPNAPVLLSRHRPAVASSIEGSNYVATNVTDDSSSSRWSSQFDDDNWIYVDLGAHKRLTSVVLHWENAYAVEYQLQASDNARDWTPLFVTTTGNGGKDAISVESEGRYVRMLGVKRKTQYGYSLFDFEVYGHHLNVPATAHAVNAGSSVSYTSGSGVFYSADKHFTGGHTCNFDSNLEIADTDDDFLFRTERNGNFTYKLPLPAGDYNVTLSFAENYWNEPGRRVFDVLSEGTKVFADLDIYSIVGKNRAFEKTFPVSVADGFLNLQFVTKKDNAKVSAIRVAPTYPSACENSNLELTDVRADFRDIWLGNEDAETGKRTDASPTIELVFNEAVDVDRLSARLVGLVPGGTEAPRDCIDSFGSPVATDAYHNVHLFGQTEDGSSTGTKLRMIPEARLRAGCSYYFVIDRFPATRDGGCMPQTYSLTFKVADKPKSAFDREMSSRRYRRFERVPTSFRTAMGINTPVAEALNRYRATLGLREGLDTLEPITGSPPSPLVAGQSLTLYRQHYRGVPVDGFGYLIQHDDGTLRSASGNLLSNIDRSVTPTTSATTAITIALQHVQPAQRPWESDPDVEPPRAELMLRATPQVPGALKLVWRVHLAGIEEALHVDLDAQSGGVLYQQPTSLGITVCEDFDEQAAVFDGDAIRPVIAPYTKSISQSRNDLITGLWSHGSTAYEMFRNVTPFPYQTSYGEGTFLNMDLTKFVCTGDDPATSKVASAHWSLQNAIRLFETFYWNDGVSGELNWKGLTGEPGQGSVALTLYDVGDDLRFRPAHRPPLQVGANDTVVLRTIDLFAQVVGHEYAHAVARYSRNRLQMPPLSVEAEGGAMHEAYGDVMGALAARKAIPPQSYDLWCFSLLGEVCDRHARDPKGAAEPGPDTYLGVNWKPIEPVCGELNDSCHIHNNSTVMSHWFSLLAESQGSDVVNDNGCSVAVAPLSTDLDLSLHMAGQILFPAFALLDAQAGLLQARETTRYVAEELYDSSASLSVDQAWHAVGVGEAPEPPLVSPDDGETDVEPWPATFRWAVGEQPGPWKLRYSKNEDFSQASVVSIDEARVEDGVRYAWARLNLDADSTYYWQGREADVALPDSWDECSAFNSWFTTSPKPVYVNRPATVERDGYYLTNHVGAMEVQAVPGEYIWLEFRLSEKDGECNANQPWERTGHTKFFVGDTIDSNIVNPPDALRLRPDWDLDPNRTYYLYARAVTNDGHVGNCSTFPVRKTQLLPFQLVSPLDYATVPYDAGGPFVWTPSAGADRYELVVTGWDEAGPLEVLREVLNAGDAELNPDGNIEYFAVDTAALNRGGKTTSEMVWQVLAFHENGDYRVGWDPGSPQFTTHAKFFAAAEEIHNVFNDGLWHDPIVPGELTNLGVVFPPGTERMKRMCFAGSANMHGALYWFGTVEEAQNIDLSTLQTAERVPESNYPACTQPLDLTTNEDRILVVWPYSWAIDDGSTGGRPVGFGPYHAFFVVVTACGGANEQCCQSTPECSPGNVCMEVDYAPGRWCVPCGAADQNCCSNGACSSGAVCEGGKCKRCGGEDQPCCGGGGCNTDGLLCENNKCVECGRFQTYPSLPCCPGRVCDTGVCNQNNNCGRCGGMNEPDCPTSTPGAAGKRCDQVIAFGENDASTYEIEMGSSSGRATLLFDTINVPDNIVVSQGDNEILESGCIGTRDLLKVSDCIWDGDRQWCCDAGGACGVDFSYSGSTTKLTVSIEPNCAGTPNTAWGFWLSCPL